MEMVDTRKVKIYVLKHPDTLEISNKAINGYVRGCGCILSKKLRLPYAKCPVNRW